MTGRGFRRYLRSYTSRRKAASALEVPQRPSYLPQCNEAPRNPKAAAVVAPKQRVPPWSQNTGAPGPKGEGGGSVVQKQEMPKPQSGVRRGCLKAAEPLALKTGGPRWSENSLGTSLNAMRALVVQKWWGLGCKTEAKAPALPRQGPGGSEAVEAPTPKRRPWWQGGCFENLQKLAKMAIFPKPPGSKKKKLTSRGLTQPPKF